MSALGTFILAMLQNPEVQKKAQAELDRVVGNHRLVDYDDQASLPYFAAMMKEVLRYALSYYRIRLVTYYIALTDGDQSLLLVCGYLVNI